MRYFFLFMVFLLSVFSFLGFPEINAQNDWLDKYASSQSDPKELSNCTSGNYFGSFGLGSWNLKVIGEDYGICNIDYGWEIEGGYTELKCRILTEKIKTTDWNNTAVPLEQNLIDNYCLKVGEGNFFFDKTEDKTTKDVFQLTNAPLYPSELVFDLSYNITNAILENVKVEYSNLIISITASENGLLEIDIPKNLYYVQNNHDVDNSLFMIVDGDEVKGLETRKPCSITYLIPFNKNSKEIELIGTIAGTEPRVPFKSPRECLQESFEVLPPLKQISNGTMPEKVTCSEEFQLIFKASDNSPACVKPESISKLIERGWTNSITNPIKDTSFYDEKFLAHDFSYQMVIEKLEKNERVSVIVILNTEKVPFDFKKANLELKAKVVSELQDIVLSKLPYFPDSKVTKFKYVPGFGINLNKPILDYLVNSSYVSSFYENKKEYIPSDYFS